MKNIELIIGAIIGAAGLFALIWGMSLACVVFGGSVTVCGM